MSDYKACHCGADCDYLDDDEQQPCWGEVNPLGISGDADFGHFCEGHAPLYDGEPYKVKDER